MTKRSKSLILEKDKLRGEVPSVAFGGRDRVYGAYLDGLNVRDNQDIHVALASSKNPKFQAFLERLESGKYKKVGLQTIAKACGIDLKEFQDWWQRESTQRAIAIAQTRSITITEDMASDARSRNAPCDRCDALGFVTAQAGLPDDTDGYRCIDPSSQEPVYVRTCPKCRGIKYEMRPGDAHSRDKLLEMSGIIKKGPGIVISQNFGNSHSSAVEDLASDMPFDVTFEDLTDV